MLDQISFFMQTMLSRFLYFVQPKKIVKLKLQRETLVQSVLGFVDKHIREVDPSYEEERILFKKEIDSGESDKSIMMKRNSIRRTSRKISNEVSNILLQNS